MIRQVYVDGYRSLSEITIPLESGLNILVGPNGGGKTNILSFFELLSRLAEMQTDEAVSSHGGIGRVFRRKVDNEYFTSLTSRVTGEIPFRARSGYKKKLHYIWEFRLTTNENYEEIEFSRQRLYLNIDRSPQKNENYDLILGTRRTENGTFLKIERMIISRLQHFFKGMYQIDASEYFSHGQAENFFKYVTRMHDLGRTSILNSLTPQMSLIRRIVDDLSGREIFNIVPEICKQPEDTSKPPVLEKNGDGLASVLHSLYRPQPLRFRARRRNSITNPQLRLSKIASYVRLISPPIVALKTAKNPIDNTVSVFVGIQSDDDKVLEFPLAQCSDGTVKWIALLTKVITTEKGFSIEEPENFLHPNVQKEFVSLVRAESKSGEYAPYTLLTTHSESLLNEASPEEVILVWMEDGKTIAKRVSNSAELVAEINRTGFGLGYYYTSGALESG